MTADNLRQVGWLYLHKRTPEGQIPSWNDNLETLESSCFWCGQHNRVKPVYVKETSDRP